MKTVSERMLEYVRFNTQSNDSTGRHPSTPGQLEFARHLAKELRELGVERVRVSEFAYVFGEIPPSAGCGEAPALGLVAHMDTSADAPGDNVRPQLVEYRGGVIPLGDSGRTLDPAVFPELNRLTGHTLITTDGTTLLGADDKAGIAEILTAVERVAAGDLPHGKLCIGFTPDEEIGEGPLHFDVADFGADYAYTLDGGGAGEIEFQNFNAATATFELRGRSVHPGSAKDVMINAQKVAFELDSLLPQDEVPEKTERFQGFYHLVHTSGSVGNARLVYLLRDHEAASFEARKRRMREAAETLNAKYGAGTVVLTIKDQYRNMEEIIRQHPFLIEIAEDAVRSAGIEPVIVPIRGGTDGATLSFKGLPCPNLGTGGYNFHGECEFASVQEMESSVQVILNIIKAFAGKK
ncbi:peptidase T [Victivallaceae bacterium BBE-744-WT-12]|uniref:Peptidase T n=1 Tax=Victivallis lenta TaxID=2606640 RepID=A0A844G0U2_9BACT|nr:peptidase T [Victivallis lenta]MST97217.1 peptidase T [Victivallis lenta]